MPIKFTALCALTVIFGLPTPAQAEQYAFPIQDAAPAATMPSAPPTTSVPSPPAQQATPQWQYPSASAPDLSSRSGTGLAQYDAAYVPTPTAVQTPAAQPSYGQPVSAYSYETLPTYPAIPSQQSGGNASGFAASAAPYRWTGCYGGAYLGVTSAGQAHAGPLMSQGGTFSTDIAYNTTKQSYDYDLGQGFAGGGTLGCAYQFARQGHAFTGFVVGVEGEIGSLSFNGNATDPNSGIVNGDTKDKTESSGWDGLIAARAGAAFDRLFVYGKLGGVYTETKSAITDTCTTSPPCGKGTINAAATRQAFDPAFGAGIEYALNKAWSVKGEYMYFDTSDSYQVCGAGGGRAAGSTFCSQHSTDGIHAVKVGVNYHFSDNLFGNGDTAPRW